MVRRCALALRSGFRRARASRVGAVVDRGASMVEYALLVSLIVVASIATVDQLQQRQRTSYSSTGSRIGALPVRSAP